MFKLLYRTGKTEKKFSKLEWIEKPRKEDEEISPFFQEHLKNIFPELKLFIFEKNGQKTTKYHLKKAKKILDAICWYPKEKFFIILEYKSREPWKKMEQIRGYLGAISDGEKGNRDCIDLFETLNKYFPKEKGISWEYGEIDWDETRIIWISPELPSEEWYYKFDDIIWIESEWYKNNNEVAVILESEDEEKLLEKLSGKKELKTKKTEIKNLPQLFQKIKVIDKKVKERSEKFHEVVEKKFLLTSTFYCPKKNYWLYDGLIRYYINGKKIFWLAIGKNLRIYFSPKTEEEVVIIKDEKSFSESLQIIKKILAKANN